MPIVTVEVVADWDCEFAATLAQSLADAVGGALDSAPGQTWVRLRKVQPDEYAENEAAADADALPVFVSILKRQLPVGAALQAEVATLTQVVAQLMNRPVGCVHVEYAPAAAGRLSLGGKLVE